MYTVVEVDGHEYLISHPDPEIAWETGMVLTKMVAEPVMAVALAAADKKDADDSEEERQKKLMDAVMKGVRGFLGNLEPSKSYALLRTILSTVEVQKEIGKEPKKMMLRDDAMLKLHFKGRPGSMLKLAVEVVRFTHADFFSAIRNGISETMEGIKS